MVAFFPRRTSAQLARDPSSRLLWWRRRVLVTGLSRRPLRPRPWVSLVAAGPLRSDPSRRWEYLNAICRLLCCFPLALSVGHVDSQSASDAAIPVQSTPACQKGLDPIVIAILRRPSPPPPPPPQATISLERVATV
ncbi:hypothetical protein LY76DRAFT_88859 [Colletotrichum caudatum]|nr:hypothetical protein LY76DRAFT_88859 [Colletotrichum caudatum]